MVKFITGQESNEAIFPDNPPPAAVAESLETSLLSTLDSNVKSRSSLYKVADYLLPTREIDPGLIPRASVVKNPQGQNTVSFSKIDSGAKESPDSELSLLIFSQI
jgi:hypothetical protein